MSSIALMSLPGEGTARLTPRPKIVWTLLGVSAIPLWALWPLFAVVSTDTMPTFQFLAIIYSIGAMTLFALRRPRMDEQSSGVDRSWKAMVVPAAMVSVGLLVSNIFFLLAIRFMPAAEANLIVYLWPLMIVVLAAPIGLLKLERRHILSIALGLGGAAFIIGPGSIGGSWAGIALAGASGLAWALFCVYRLRQGAEAPDALGVGLALSAVASIVIHLGLEATVIPSPISLLSAVLNGVVPLALGNLVWDYGLRRGNRALLTVIAYATPLVSALILIAFGLAQATMGLLIGGGLIVAGSVISARLR